MEPKFTKCIKIEDKFTLNESRLTNKPKLSNINQKKKKYIYTWSKRNKIEP